MGGMTGLSQRDLARLTALAKHNTLPFGKLALANGQTLNGLTTAITTTVTTTTEPAGSLAITSNATGIGHIFVSAGGKWVTLV